MGSQGVCPTTAILLEISLHSSGGLVFGKPSLFCWFSAGNEGTTLTSHPLWFLYGYWVHSISHSLSHQQVVSQIRGARFNPNPNLGGLRWACLGPRLIVVSRPRAAISRGKIRFLPQIPSNAVQPSCAVCFSILPTDVEPGRLE